MSEESLLDTATEAAPAEAPVEAPAEPTQDVKFGAHDPATVPEKFIDTDTGELKLQELINSNIELEKSFHARAPEAYEFTEVFEQNNLAFDNEEQEQEVSEVFKKHKLSQDAVNDILGMYGARATQMMELLGPQIDKEQEMSSLKTEWGEQTDTRIAELREFVQQQGYPPEVYQHSPLQSAAGLQMMYELMKNTQGPTVMRETVQPVEDLQARLQEVVANPSYHNAMSVDHKKLQQRAAELSSKIASQK